MESIVVYRKYNHDKIEEFSFFFLFSVFRSKHLFFRSMNFSPRLFHGCGGFFFIRNHSVQGIFPSNFLTELYYRIDPASLPDTRCTYFSIFAMQQRFRKSLYTASRKTWPRKHRKISI